MLQQKFNMKNNSYIEASTAIANFLIEVATNQRKLQYCREILSSNPSFAPQKYFQNAAKRYKNQLYRIQLETLLADLDLHFNQDEKTLIFSYFRRDDKQYINYDQFYALIVPHNDTSLTKLMQKREMDDFVLDYSLKYALQKYFTQICQSQCALQSDINFEIESNKSEPRRERNRLTIDSIEQFLNLHGKYPEKNVSALIMKEVSQNKGSNRRYILIREFVASYLSKVKQNRGQIPKVMLHSPVNPIQATPFTPKVNKSNIELKASKYSSTPINSLIDVENKIQNLMSAIFVPKPSPIVFKAEDKQQRPIQNPKIRSPQQKKVKNEDLKIKSQSTNLLAKPRQNKPEGTVSKSDQSRQLSTSKPSSLIQRQKLRKRFNLQTQIEQIQPTADLLEAKIISEPPLQQPQAAPVAKEQPEVMTVRQQSNQLDDQRYSRYKRYNYLKQSKRDYSQRLQYLKNLVQSPSIATSRQK